MNKVIIFKNDEGGISIIHPVTTVEAAIKAVPDGKAYGIFDKADIPTDRTFRDAWTIDDSELTEGPQPVQPEPAPEILPEEPVVEEPVVEEPVVEEPVDPASEV